jgi:hypothetical protein
MMGKISDLFYKLTRGKQALKPWEHGPAKAVLSDKCGCNGNCQCNSIESLEKSAGIAKKVSVKIVPATVDGTIASIPREIAEHMVEEGILTPAKPKRKPKLEQVIEDAERMKKPPVIEGINKKVSDNKKAPAKKPVAKTTEKKQAIAKDLADTPSPVVKKPVAKKPAPKKK